MRLLVTGASGFVGGATVRRLLADGHAVRAALRAPASLPSGVEPVLIGDLGQAVAWREPLAGIEAVVHLAGVAHGKDPGQAQAVNVEATHRLAQAAAAAGVRRFLLLSSVKAMADEAREPLTEQDAPRAADAYGRSKLAGEHLLADAASASGMEVVVLRPPLVFGPGVAANFRSLLRLVASGVPLPLGGIDNRRSFIFLENLADAIAVAVGHAGKAAGTWLVADQPARSTPELIRAIAAAMDGRARLFALPPSLLGIARGLPGGGALDRLTSSLALDDSAFRRHFGWTPPVAFDRALAVTAEWFARET